MVAATAKPCRCEFINPSYAESSPEFQPMPSRRRSSPAPAIRIIASDADVREGIRLLRRKCAYVRKMHDLTGDPPLRLREAGFEGLARIVVSQQVSVASAAAIWTRFAASVSPVEANAVLAASDETLRAAGLSQPKIRTLRAISSAIANRVLALDAFDLASEEAVHEALTRVSGIGPWTADVFSMFCLGRADAFASGDLALQEAVRIVMKLNTRPGPAEVLAVAERWRPWRSVAARLLWSYYALAKQREGMPT